MHRLRPLIGIAALLLVWQGALSLKLVNPILFPPPLAALDQILIDVRSGSLNPDFLATVFRTLQAFAIAALIGIPVGVALGSSRAVYDSVEFVIDFFRSTPASALIPLFLLLFGLSDTNKIAIAAFAAFLVIVFGSAYSVLNARKTRVLAARAMGVSSFRIFTDVLVMESLPNIIVSLRNGISIALVIVIVAEMFIGSEEGLGHRIIDAQQVFDIRKMYAAIIVTGALGYLLNMLFLVAERRLVHWSGK